MSSTTYLVAKVLKKENCAPCAVLSRLLPGLQAAYPNIKWEVEEANLDNAAEIAETYGIKSFPTTIIFKVDDAGRVEVGRQAGSLGVNKLLEKVTAENA